MQSSVHTMYTTCRMHSSYTSYYSRDRLRQEHICATTFCMVLIGEESPVVYYLIFGAGR